MVSYKKEISVTTSETQPTPSDSLGLQTYEFFNGGDQRQHCIRQFTDGAAVQIELDYPELFSDVIDEHIRNLYDIASSPEYIGGVHSATSEYRLAEAYLLKTSQRLSDKVRPVSQAELDSFQDLNEAVYGKPDELIVQQMLSRIWTGLDKKRGTVADPIIHELETGFVFTAQSGESTEIPPLPVPDVEAAELDDLPELTTEALQWLQETLQAELAPAKGEFEQYFAEHIEQREDPSIQPADIAEMFRRGIRSLGLDGVRVIEKEGATALSWSSTQAAVVVGTKRKPLSTTEELLGIFAHEVGVHGRRFIGGQQLDDESLANGLFTEADDGEDPSYLTFEEGLAATIQKAVQGKNEAWGITSTALYLNVSLAHQGWSPRQIQEVMSRVRTVLSTKSDAEGVSQAVLDKARSAAATGVTRVFRGTPSQEVYQTTDGVTLHYAKDLAYAAGKVKAIRMLNQMATLPEVQRAEAWQHLLSGKFDPTNSRQSAYVESVVRGRI